MAQHAAVAGAHLPGAAVVVTALLDTAAGWPVIAVLTVVGGLLVIESGTVFGVVLPGTTLLVALGIWVHVAGTAVGPAIAVAAVATVTGAHFGWWRGRTGVGPLRSGPVGARTWLAGRGTAGTAGLVAIGHWAAAARPIMPRVAGAAGVPYRLVGPILVVSGTAWAAAIVLLGNRLGPAVVTHAAWVPIVLVALVIGALVLHQRRTFPTVLGGCTAVERASTRNGGEVRG
ncbi:hypothetical protein WEH80_12290 [Actinomycetes bacterium KLBMP 9759]